MMNYINHKSKVNASIYFEDICTKPLLKIIIKSLETLKLAGKVEI